MARRRFCFDRYMSTAFSGDFSVAGGFQSRLRYSVMFRFAVRKKEYHYFGLNLCESSYVYRELGLDTWMLKRRGGWCTERLEGGGQGKTGHACHLVDSPGIETGYLRCRLIMQPKLFDREGLELVREKTRTHATRG